MKKVIQFLLIAAPFIFFSCASKDIPTDVLPQDLSALSEENISPEALDAIQSAVENNPELVEKLTAETSSEVTTLEISETEEVVEDYLHQNLEEIIEPEVITVEPDLETIEIIESEIVIEDSDNDEVSVINEDTVDIDKTKTSENSISYEQTAEQIPVQEEESISPTEKTVSVNVDELQSAVSQPEQTIEITDDVIEITDEESENSEQEEAPAVQIVPSRSVTLKRTEYLDITYPGNGWIYMGITDNSKDITYFGRKVGTENTKFSVQARNAGTKILHFYKNDPITGTFIDDYLEVVVLEEKGSNKTHIIAPEYKSPVLQQKPQAPVPETVDEEQPAPAAEQKQTPPPSAKQPEPVKQAPASKPEPVSKSSPKTIEKPVSAVETPVPVVEEPVPQAEEAVINPEDFLSDAKKQLKEKSYVQAYNNIIRFLDVGTTHIDEALFIKAQILEAKSDVQNINEAIKTYTTLTKNYPASKYWDDANKRIIYLKRFYLEGR